MPKTILATGKHLVLRPIVGRQRTAAGLYIPANDPETGRPLLANCIGRCVSVGLEVMGPLRDSLGKILVSSRPMHVQPDGPDSDNLIITQQDHVVGVVEEMDFQAVKRLEAYRVAERAGLSEEECWEAHQTACSVAPEGA